MLLRKRTLIGLICLVLLCAFTVIATRTTASAKMNAQSSIPQAEDLSNQLPEGYQYEGQDNPKIKKFIPASDTKVSINKHYFQACEEALGKIPVEKIDCRDAVPIPVQRTISENKVVKLDASNTSPSIPRFDNASKQVKQGENGYIENITTCDKPSGIFRDMKNVGCVDGSRTRYLHKTLKKGGRKEEVDWVYICRKNNKFLSDPYLFNELGLIGYNRSTGKTCYFAGQPTLEFEVTGNWLADISNKDSVKTTADIEIITGKQIPPPNYSNFNPESVNHWTAPTGAGGCVRCHSQGPFVRYPFNEPVCLVKKTNNQEKKDSQEKCEQSFSEIKECQKHVSQDYECRVLKPKRTPGMLYSVISPTDRNGELYKAINSDPTIDKGDKYYKELLGPGEQWHHPQRLVEKDAASCTLCHAIGNGDYYKRFVNSMFSIHSLTAENKLKIQDDYHFRSKLFVSNTSDLKRVSTPHDQRLTRKDGILPLPKTELEMSRREFSTKKYVEAIKRINECVNLDSNNNPDEKCHWEEHWTPERVAQKPLDYLKANCTYCHTQGMAPPVLETESNFKDKRERVIARMYNNIKRPMPPSGQLPDSVKDSLIDYLKSN